LASQLSGKKKRNLNYSIRCIIRRNVGLLRLLASYALVLSASAFHALCQHLLKRHPSVELKKRGLALIVLKVKEKIR
jgi:hypothetical protein